MIQKNWITSSAHRNMQRIRRNSWPNWQCGSFVHRTVFQLVRKMGNTRRSGHPSITGMRPTGMARHRNRSFPEKKNGCACSRRLFFLRQSELRQRDVERGQQLVGNVGRCRRRTSGTRNAIGYTNLRGVLEQVSLIYANQGQFFEIVPTDKSVRMPPVPSPHWGGARKTAHSAFGAFLGIYPALLGRPGLSCGSPTSVSPRAKAVSIIMASL